VPIKSLQEIKDRQREAPDWILPSFLKRGNTMFIIGQPKKCCKSWLILELGWQLSLGEGVWGMKAHQASSEMMMKPPRPMRTVIFGQEDTEDDWQDRLEAHFNRGRLPNDRLWVVPKDLKIRMDTTDGLKLIKDVLDYVVARSGPVDLVAFDPMRRFHRGDENDSTVIAKMWEVLDWIHHTYNCATIFSHHVVKPPQDRSNYDPTDPFNGRGSGDIYGGGDAFVVVVPGKGDKEQRRVSMFFESKRGPNLDPAEIRVTFKDGKCEWLGPGFLKKKSKEHED
jgi:RecA-family ATPase